MSNSQNMVNDSSCCVTNKGNERLSRSQKMLRKLSTNIVLRSENRNLLK